MASVPSCSLPHSCPGSCWTLDLFAHPPLIQKDCQLKLGPTAPPQASLLGPPAIPCPCFSKLDSAVRQTRGISRVRGAPIGAAAEIHMLSLELPSQQEEICVLRT